MTSGAVPSSDLGNPDWWRPFPADDFGALLEHEGLWRDEGTGMWCVARHADVLAVERDSETFASREDDAGAYRFKPSEHEATMISQDDPAHLEQRRLVNRRFTPRAVRSHAEHYEAMVADLVEQGIRINERVGCVEVVNAWAAQLPGRVTAELIGFGPERWRDVKSWSERQMRIDTRFEDPGVYADLTASITEWAMVMREELPKRLSEPGDDLFTDWLAAGMSPETMVQETGLMIAGGAETTRTVIAHGLRAFVDHPEAWERLGTGDTAVIDRAVEEVIRWVTPLNNMFRIATCDSEIAGTAISEGDRLCLVYPAANRDPRVFDDPGTFDIDRDPNPHLAFGHGTHFCLGANLARIELRLLFGELARRITNLRVVAEPDIEPNIFARAVRRFDLTFDEREPAATTPATTRASA